MTLVNARSKISYLVFRFMDDMPTLQNKESNFYICFIILEFLHLSLFDSKKLTAGMSL